MLGHSGATGETWHPSFMGCAYVMMDSIKKLSLKAPYEVVALEVDQSCLPYKGLNLSSNS